jgi:lipopolysaccharide export system ATP-binding protein
VNNIEKKLTLRAEGLVKAYHHRRVVDDVSFEVKPSEIVGLLGPNGAGKTTSFYIVVGLIKPDEGRIFLGEEELSKLPMYKRARLGISYLPQEPSVFRKLSVEDNIKAILETLKLPPEESKARLEKLLEELGLKNLRKAKAYTLSGGERRRVEIARALSITPKFILLDEPFAGIDPIAVAELQSLIKELKKRDIGVLITDHNVHETLKICDRGYILNEGVIIVSGTPSEITSHPLARKHYLGEGFSL